MATVLYEYFHLTDVWFKTGIIPNINTRIEVDNAGYNTIGDGQWPGLIGSNNTDWDSTTALIKLGNNSTAWNVRFGNIENTNCGSVTLGNRYSISLDKNYFTFNGTQYTVGTTYYSTSNSDIWIGTCNMNGSSFRPSDSFVGNVRIYQDNVLVGDFIPCIKDGEYCYYDDVTDTYLEKFGTGTIEIFNPLHVFTASQSKLSFQSIQSSQNITITAETGWTATTNNSWISLSQNTGSTGDTNITVTVADGSSEGSRVGKITFTDDEDYTFDVDVFQLKLGMKVYVNKYKVGSTNIVKQQSGEDNVNKMYMGNDLVYQKYE